MDRKQQDVIEQVIRSALDKAERIWTNHGLALDEQFRADSVNKREVVPSNIPGHAVVRSGDEKVGTFIALAADMRDSSQHLNCAIAGCKASELERVFYETSALLPALARTIEIHGGAVTEYLGDGILAFVELDESNRESSIRAAYRAARDCLETTLPIVNIALCERYGLPALKVGIGLAMSKGVVSLVGIPGNSHPKVVGRCVYFATKLSAGINEVVVDKALREAWPRSNEGTLRFERCRRRDVDGHIVFRDES